MKNRLLNSLFFLTSFCVFVTQTWVEAAETTNSNAVVASNAPTFKASVDAELLSHFVYHGLSQTNKDPCLRGSFWFNMGPQFRLGVSGSNTNYEGSDIHLWLKFSGDIKVDITSDSNLAIRFSQNQFYRSDTRNGNTIAIDLNLLTYHVIYELESNWDGTRAGSSYFSYQKSYDVFGNWKWGNQIGYAMVKATGYSDYFDVRSGLGTKLKDIFVEAYLTATSASSQFSGRGDLFAVVSAQTTF